MTVLFFFLWIVGLCIVTTMAITAVFDRIDQYLDDRYEKNGPEPLLDIIGITRLRSRIRFLKKH